VSALRQNGKWYSTIAVIGTVLLQCLDHNSGDEKVITLTQVLHMPGTTAHLISMGEMLQHNIESLAIREALASLTKLNAYGLGQTQRTTTMLSLGLDLTILPP